MKSSFHGYFRPTKSEFATLWKKSIFVFDANTLLNIYRYSPATRDGFIEILRHYSDRIWIPHQVGLEFHKNRLSVINEQRAAYGKLKKEFADAKSRLENELNHFIKHPYLNIHKFKERVGSFEKSIIEEIDKIKGKHPDLNSDEDGLRDKIVEIFENKVGPKYAKERINEVIKEGKNRYDEGIPPGYMDKSKGNPEQYSDLIIWFQILEKAKSASLPILFITDDGKEDWWHKFSGKTIGPRPELVQEMKEDAAVNFYMYSPDTFIEEAQRLILRNVKKEMVEEVRDVSESRKSMGFAEHIAAKTGLTFANQPLAAIKSMGFAEHIKALDRAAKTGLAGARGFEPPTPQQWLELTAAAEELAKIFKDSEEAMRPMGLLSRPEKESDNEGNA